MDAGNISLAENAKNKALEIESELLSTGKFKKCFSHASPPVFCNFSGKRTQLGHEQFCLRYFLIDTDSSSGVGDDVSIDDQDFRIENSFLNDPREGVALGNQNGVRNDGQVLVGQTEAAWEDRNETDIPDGHQNNILLPINTNITQNPDVWALANNIGKCSKDIIVFYSFDDALYKKPS